MDILTIQDFTFVGSKGCSRIRIPGIGKGEVISRKRKNKKWGWWLGLGALLFFVASWLTYITCQFVAVPLVSELQLSFSEVVAVVAVFSLRMTIILLGAFVVYVLWSFRRLHA